MKRNSALLVLVLALAALLPAQAPEAKPTQKPAETPKGEAQERPRERRQGVAGEIVSIQGDEIMLKDREGKTVKVKTTAETRFLKDRQPVALKDFKVGDRVAIGGEPAGEGVWNARAVMAGEGMMMGGGGQGGGMRAGAGFAGTISELKGDDLLVKTLENKDVTVKTTADTRVLKNRQFAAVKDLKPGDGVMVMGEKTSETEWKAVGVMEMTDQIQKFKEGLGKEFIMGKVQSIDETKLTILRPDGQTQVIEVDENTSFKKQNESITLADIKVGDQVGGRGAVKNGTFVPTELRVGLAGGGLGMVRQNP